MIWVISNVLYTTYMCNITYMRYWYCLLSTQTSGFLGSPITSDSYVLSLSKRTWFKYPQWCLWKKMISKKIFGNFGSNRRDKGGKSVSLIAIYSWSWCTLERINFNFLIDWLYQLGLVKSSFVWLVSRSLEIYAINSFLIILIFDQL